MLINFLRELFQSISKFMCETHFNYCSSRYTVLTLCADLYKLSTLERFYSLTNRAECYTLLRRRPRPHDARYY